MEEMKGGSYHNNGCKMIWNINDRLMAHTMGYVKDSPRIDDLLKLGRMD